MLKTRIVVWLGFTWGWVPPVGAQDAEVPFLLGDPPAADDEWNSEYDGTWDPDWDRAFTQSSAAWQVSVAGGARQNGDAPSASQAGTAGNAQREYYALATLQLPLDQLSAKSTGPQGAAPRRSHAANSSTLPTPDPLISSSAGAHPSNAQTAEIAPRQAGFAGDEIAAASEVPPTARTHSNSSAQRVLLRQTLALTEQLMDHVTGTVSDRAALQALASLTKRSRWSGLVPELRVRGVYGFDRTVSQQDSSGIYPGDLTTRGGHDSLIEGRLSFRLDRLVYGDQEGALNQRRREIRVHEEKRKRDAVASLSVWLDARRRRAFPDLAPEQLFKLIREEQEALLSLYLMSDGWFEGEATLQRLGYAELLQEVDGMPFEQTPELDGASELGASQKASRAAFHDLSVDGRSTTKASAGPQRTQPDQPHEPSDP